MILKSPENRKQIIDYLETVDEDTFIDEIVINLFGSQGYQVYRINSHGPGEHGKDIIFCRYIPMFLENEFIAVQAKSAKVTTSNVGKFSNQIKRALKTKFAPRSGAADLLPHYAVFINAKKHSNDAYTEFPQLVGSGHVKILSQENVCELILQTGIAPDRLLKQLSTSAPETQPKEDKLVFDIILGNNPGEIDNLLEHKLKFLKDEITAKTKSLVIDYIYDRWQMDRSWAGTVKPMKWFDTYFDFLRPTHSKYLFTIFEELMSSNPSFDAMQYTQSIVRKITPELLEPIEGEFVTFCAQRSISYPMNNIDMLFLKLGELVEGNLIKDKANSTLANKILLMVRYDKKGDKKKSISVETEIYNILQPERSGRRRLKV